LPSATVAAMPAAAATSAITVRVRVMAAVRYDADP
jgi:hypothetical protein